MKRGGFASEAVARMERSAIRDSSAASDVPDIASLHRSYEL